jgi:hypothetical protein
MSVSSSKRIFMGFVFSRRYVSSEKTGYELETGGCNPLREWLYGGRCYRQYNDVGFNQYVDVDVSHQYVDVDVSHQYVDISQLSIRSFTDPNLPLPFRAVNVKTRDDSMNDEFKGNYILRKWLD